MLISFLKTHSKKTYKKNLKNRRKTITNSAGRKISRIESFETPLTQHGIPFRYTALGDHVDDQILSSSYVNNFNLHYIFEFLLEK